MPEAARTPNINLRVRVRGKRRSEAIIVALREQFGVEAEIVEPDDEELVNVFETEWYKETKRQTTPGDMLNTLRWKHQLTQAELARRIGVCRQNISAIESGKRGLGIKTALKIAAVMGEPVERFFPHGMPA